MSVLVAGLLAAGCTTPIDSLVPTVPPPSPTDSDGGPATEGVLTIATDPATLAFALVTSYREIPDTTVITGSRVEAGETVLIESSLSALTYEVRANERPCGLVEVVPGVNTRITLVVTDTSCAIRR